MTLRSFVSMIILAGVYTLPALVADAGERPAPQTGEPSAAGRLGACCLQVAGTNTCLGTINDEATCQNSGGTWHPRAECAICGCGKLAPAGTDCWHTVCGSTQYDFQNSPLPAGFFGPGSALFDDLVKLGSLVPFQADTFIQRLGDMCFDGPEEVQTPIQIVELNLVSCQPIIVMFDDAATQWNMTVALDGPQTEGTLFAKKTDAAGGTFNTLLPVRPKFKFTRVDTGQTVATGPGRVPETTLEALGVRWHQFQPPFGTCGPGGFSPGEIDLERECCPETCHSSFGTAAHEHCVIPPNCIPCAIQTGACCDRRIADPTTRCLDDVPEDSCIIDDRNQVSWLKDTPCSQIDCREHVGACCDRRIADPIDRCVDNVPESSCVIDDPNQVSWLKDTPCSQIECREHTGSCCDGNNGSCEDDVRESDCPVDPNDPLNQITWRKGGSCFNPTNGEALCLEHTGACCDGNDGSCNDDVLRSDCAGDQLSWLKGTRCGSFECVEHTGACCNDRTGFCVSNVPESQCLTSPDDSFGPWRWTKGLRCNQLDPSCGPRGACCISGTCLGVIEAEACREEGGDFFEGKACDVCSRGPSEPCEHCGLVDHWVDDPACPGGVDRLGLSGATFGLIFDLDGNDDCSPDVSVRAHGPTWINFSGPLDDSTWFPGTRDTDNHFDVRDTEIVSMDLVSVNGDVRMTAGWGRGAIPLPHSYGAIAELPGDKALAHSFFEMFVEIEVLDAGGNVIARVYNRDPVLVQADIDCIPPDVGYIHPNCLENGPIPLFLSPTPGDDAPVLWLVDADHRTFVQRGACCDGTTGNCVDAQFEAECPVNPDDPLNQFSWHKETLCVDVGCREHTGACCDRRTNTCEENVPESQCRSPNEPDRFEWAKDTACDELDPPCEPRGACCLDGTCLGVIGAQACRSEGGSWFEDKDCEVCSRPPSEPCEHCGLTEHWVDDTTCPGGVDRLELSSAKFGLDFDVESDECEADVSVRTHGPTWINFSGPRDDSFRFPGLRNLDGHRDVRDTEIVSMHLVSPNGQIRMTAGWGLGAIPLPHTYGAIAELPGDKALADSFFEAFVEIEVLDEDNNVLGRLYNQEPVLVEAVIDCIPPDANYIHPVGCIPLWTSPIPGEGVHVANLVSAEHRTFEQQGACCDGTTGNCVDGQFEAECPVNPNDPLNQFSWRKGLLCSEVGCREHTGACCFASGGTCVDDVPESQCPVDPNDPFNTYRWVKDTPCDRLDEPCEPRGACCIEDIRTKGGLGCNGVVLLSECHEKQGLFFEGQECEVCFTNPAEPCKDCDGDPVTDPPCPPGVDRLTRSSALLGLDLDMDPECTPEISVRARGPTWINRIGPMENSFRFPDELPGEPDGNQGTYETEIVSMYLMSPDGRVTMIAGRGGPSAMPLQPSFGVITPVAIPPKWPQASFFDVFVEINIDENNGAPGAATFPSVLYNQTPLRVEAEILCIPPDADYIHPTDCFPLYTSPIPGEGEHVANLVSARHRTFEADCFETIGGSIYTDCNEPLTSGEGGVAVTVVGPEGVFNAVTSGPSGVWKIQDVPCGVYEVTPDQAFREYCHVDIGGDCPPEPCEDSAVINVDPANRAENLSIQFLGRDDCIRNDMNFDEICTIVFDVDLFVQCVYDGDCVGPTGRDLKCPADCNCDDLATIVFDADCFVDHVFGPEGCHSCDEPNAKSRATDGRRAGFTIGGAVYDDASNPLFSGVQRVKVRVLDSDRRVVATAATAGPSGIWRVDDLPEGDYTVVIQRRTGRAAAGRNVIRITVNADNEAANLSIAVLHASGPTRSRDVRRDPR